TTAPTITTTSPTTTTPYFRTTIAPLSKIPLQFTVHVESHNAPSCLDGDYFPIFLSPTPANGVNLPAFVNHTLEITVRSTAQFTTIYDLIVTGPSSITKQKVSTGLYTIQWTPTEQDVNDHFPICFVSEARDRYQVYQSELRCVTADVGHQEATVTCNETTITVEVEKSYLIRRNLDNLHLNDFTDPSCNLTTHSNETHLMTVMSLNACGTHVEEDEDNIIFVNEISSADPDEIISRRHDVEIVFSCSYPKRTNLTLGFRHKNPYAFTEKGFGAFTFQFEFFESQRFRKQVDGSTYPVEVYLKQMIFMQIEATTNIPNTELFVESCKATPYDNPNSRISYTIIENGCVKDKTVQIYPSSKSQFRFGMEAFEFIGAHDEVYITCSVLLCESGASGTRCSQGCISSNSGTHRRKREAAAETGRHSISQGPLHLVKTSDSQSSGVSMNLGMNLVFVGCLLVCGVVIYRAKRSRPKYQALPTSEED
ncbi:ZP domain-containing protein-like, partial [Mugil cephalus]|uniref:ZP domain-containing protein-like n=1 Tax=Mugil cephalus TaxID=48193 RepID=UPI001FB6E0EC